MAAISQYDPAAATQVVWLAKAPTGRAKCKISGKPINKGDTKVCMLMWTSGRRAQVGMLPKAWANRAANGGVTIEKLDKNGGGKCKFTQKVLKKGDTRVRVSIEQANFFLSMEGAKNCLTQAFKAGGKSFPKDAKKIGGGGSSSSAKKISTMKKSVKKGGMKKSMKKK